MADGMLQHDRQKREGAQILDFFNFRFQQRALP
jgi:hypothetical protein